MAQFVSQQSFDEQIHARVQEAYAKGTVITVDDKQGLGSQPEHKAVKRETNGHKRKPELQEASQRKKEKSDDAQSAVANGFNDQSRLNLVGPQRPPHTKIQEVITKYLKHDSTCATEMDCFSFKNFLERVDGKYVLKAPFNVDAHATPQMFIQEFRKFFPNKDYPSQGNWFMNVRFDSRTDEQKRWQEAISQLDKLYELVQEDGTPNLLVIDKEVPDTVRQIVANLIPQELRSLLTTFDKKLAMFLLHQLITTSGPCTLTLPFGPCSHFNERSGKKSVCNSGISKRKYLRECHLVIAIFMRIYFVRVGDKIVELTYDVSNSGGVPLIRTRQLSNVKEHTTTKFAKATDRATIFQGLQMIHRDLIKQSFSTVSLTSWYLEHSQLCLDLNDTQFKKLRRSVKARRRNN